MMTLDQLQRLFPGFALVGEGKRIAQVCRTSRHIILYANDCEAAYYRYKSCGDGCNFRVEAHIAYRLGSVEGPEAPPAPGQKISRAWRQYVEAQ